MKKITFSLPILIVIISFQTSYTQPPDWNRLLQIKTIGLPSIDAVTTDANNICIAARIQGPITFDGNNFTNVGLCDLVIAQINYAGVLNWKKQINAQAGGTIYANAIKTDAAGNIFVIGTFSGTTTIGNKTITSSALYNAFYAKFDASGNGLWATAFISTGTGTNRIAIDGSGNSYLISKNNKLLKFSGSGVLQWEQSYPLRTLQAIAIYGSNLYIGGTLSWGTTNFGTIALTSLGTASNTGFLVKADLDGVYSNSMIVGGSTTAYGSTVSDIVFDVTGNLIITGGYTKDLILGSITITNTDKRYYSYIAKCDNSFAFTWAKSSAAFTDQNSSSLITSYRIFLDNSNNIYEFGMNTCTFTFGSVTITNSLDHQFLIKFDAAGNATNGYALQYTSSDKIAVTSVGKIVITGTYNLSGNPSYGNFFLSQYDNTMIEEWHKVSSNSFSGIAKINYVKHDVAGNAFIQSRIIGYCNYFGTIINTTCYLTIISKHDVNGNLLWMKQIKDISPNTFGSAFILDKNKNILTVGLFNSILDIGTTTLTSTNIDYEGYVAKYSSNGQFLWASTFNIGNIKTDSYANSYITLASDSVENVVVSGVINPANYLVKFDPLGNKLWAKIFPMNSYYLSLVSTDANKNIYLTSEIHLSDDIGSATIGTITLNQTTNDGATALIKFDPDGNALWARTYGGVAGLGFSDGWPCDIKNDAAGNVYLWGTCLSKSVFGTTTLINPFRSSGYYYSYYLAKINTSGDVIWAKAIHERSYGYNYGDLLDLDKNGNIYIGGHFVDSISIEGTKYIPVGLNDFLIAKYSNAGEFQWKETIPSDIRNITALNVYGDNILSIGGGAGKNSTLGSFNIDRGTGSTCIVATLGNLKYLTISANALSIEAPANSTKTFSVTSNIGWTTVSDKDWLTVKNGSGYCNAIVTLSAKANPTNTERTATVTVSGVGVDPKTISVTQSGGTIGVEELDNNQSITAYPNPCNGKFNLSFDNFNERNISIIIHNSLGINVKEIKVNNLLINHNQEIDLSNMAEGVYYINIQTNKTKVVKELILTNH